MTKYFDVPAYDGTWWEWKPLRVYGKDAQGNDAFHDGEWTLWHVEVTKWDIFTNPFGTECKPGKWLPCLPPPPPEGEAIAPAG